MGELPYAAVQVATGKTERGVIPWTISLLVLTVLAVIVSAWGAVLNYEAGDLPWRLGHTSSAKPILNEVDWRYVSLPDAPDRLTRPLTTAEQTEMNREISRNRREEELSSSLKLLDLLQIPLIPLVLILLIGLPVVFVRHRMKRWRWLVGIAFGLVLICGALMGYFMSSGW